MTYREHIRAAGAAYLSALLDAHNGIVSHAAKVAGIRRQDMYRLLRRHGIASRFVRQGHRGNADWQAGA